MPLSDIDLNNNRTGPNRREPRRRGSSPSTLARELQKMAESSAAKLTELAKEEGEKLTRKTAEVVSAALLAETQDREDHARVRAGLNTITGGAIERLIRVSTDEDIKAFLREHGWRV